MELVRIQLECSQEAARTILPLLLKARERAHSDEDGWFCFYVKNGFSIGNVDFGSKDDAESIALHEDVASQNSLWSGGAIFVYELDGETYEHKEEQVIFSDGVK